MSVNWFLVSCYVFLFWLKSSAFNGVLCFKFHVSGLAKKFSLQNFFMFQTFWVFYISSFIILLQRRHDKKWIQVGLNRGTQCCKPALLPLHQRNYCVIHLRWKLFMGAVSCFKFRVFESIGETKKKLSFEGGS